MSPSFGFSIGDFIAVGDLARRIVKALDESRGSTADYRSLCEVLFSLDRSLQVASAVFFHLSSNTNTDTGCSPSVGPLNGIRHELGCCKRLMEGFLVSSRTYTETLLNGQGSRFRKEWKKIQWCLFQIEDAQELQERLKIHIDVFNIYASTIMRQSVARTEQKAIEISESTHRTEKNMTEVLEASNRVELVVREAFATIKSIQNDMPKIMGHIWEGGCIENQQLIQLEDALGRTTPLPLLLCDDNEKLHTLLMMMFKGLPGQERISQREYEITDALEGASIGSLEWETKVLPGTRIAMAVIIIKTIFNSAIESGPIAHRCHRCSGSNAGAIPEKGSLKCRHCQLVFRTTEKERIVELPDGSPEQASAIGTHQAAVPGDGSGEEYAFRRIHYLREVLKHQVTKGHEEEHLYTDTALPSRFRRGLGSSSGGGSVPYCRNCGYGPHNPHIYVGCANCGYILWGNR